MRVVRLNKGLPALLACSPGVPILVAWALLVGAGLKASQLATQPVAVGEWWDTRWLRLGVVEFSEDGLTAAEQLDLIRTEANELMREQDTRWHQLRSEISDNGITVLEPHELTREDKAWLDSIFRAAKGSLVQHARGHRDHFHVRFYNGRAQELGRRVQPLLALRPEHNIVHHRIRSGDTLGHIARRYETTVKLIQKANRMRGSFLRAGRMLEIPLRKPCTKCPVPPEVVVPARRVPPAAVAGEAQPSGQ